MDKDQFVSSESSNKPPPELIADAYNFKLAYVDADGKHYYAGQAGAAGDVSHPEYAG